jgi:RNA-directed DNA polymerase
MNTASQPMYEWKDIPWRKIERDVFKLQKRIFQASKSGDVKTVRRLQRLLINSRSAKLLATRRVTQDNRGKKTAGVDGVKEVLPHQRLEMAQRLTLSQKAAPVRRVWIPKPGKDELRPLGIPVMQDRAAQALVKSALEPEWEARFEPNSYGFRPGRSCWDAIGAIYRGICQSSKWVLDADIAKCYDNINHQALLRKLNASPIIQRQVKAWLKAGVLDGNQLFHTEAGTPQGGVISPLLANIALHGMESLIKAKFPENKRKRFWTPLVVRYADDFVIMHEDRQTVEQCQQIISEWLTEMGLELKPSKTCIAHTLEKGEDDAGFNFLGFNIRQYPVGKTKTGKRTNGEPLGFKTHIKPSKEAQKRHQAHMAEVIDRHKDANQYYLIETLNPIIWGWSQYYSTVVSARTFGKMDTMLFQKLRAWAVRRHPNKGEKWAIGKYWRIDDGEGWNFRPKDSPAALYCHARTPIRRHVKIQSERSPYDGDFIYWSIRRGNSPDCNVRIAKLLRKQKGTCWECGLYFKDGDLMEVDHIIPKEHGGKDAYYNWQLLHRHCHDKKTAEDRQWHA